MPRNNYECPRCGYETCNKCKMRNHLNRIRKCKNDGNLELTEEIKQTVLNDHKYVVDSSKKKPQSKTIQTINNFNTNYNTMNNFINNIDVFTKLSHLLNYQNQKSIGLGDKLESKYGRCIDKLDNDEYKFGFNIGQDEILDIIDKSVQVDISHKLEELDVLYNTALNKISLYHDDEWESYLMDAGVKELIRIIRDYYLEKYELFMIRKIFDSSNDVSAIDKNKFQNQLEEYYKFLAYFELFPYAHKKPNSEIIENYKHSNDTFISDACTNLYHESKNKITKSDINKIKKQVVSIIKTNTQANINNLNKNIINTINMDEEFKNILFNQMYSN